MSIFKSKKQNQFGKAVVLLKTVKEGILAEKVIKEQGYTLRKIAPPNEYRKGCEIAVEIDFDKEKEVEKILIKYDIEFQGIVQI
jgi:hypothetical protein